jgi:hypothetical protein
LDGTLSRAFDGRLLVSLNTPDERPVFVPVRCEDGRLLAA